MAAQRRTLLALTNLRGRDYRAAAHRTRRASGTRRPPPVERVETPNGALPLPKH
ncbi:hypothetical protein [Micropruina sp.]|uniref:hypothetical protein n=1 Tax=Micropruina sp. TaxID=2737536 RepID=UPI0039E4F73E